MANHGLIVHILRLLHTAATLPPRPHCRCSARQGSLCDTDVLHEQSTCFVLHAAIRLCTIQAACRSPQPQWQVWTQIWS